MVQSSVIQALFGFALAAMFWPGLAGAAEPSRWCFLAVAVPALLFFTTIRMTRAHWLLLGLCAWSALGLLWAPVLDDALYGCFSLALCAGVFAIAVEVEEPIWFYRGLGAGLAISSGVAVLQRFGLEPVIAQFPGSGPNGLFVNPSILGESMVVGFVVLLAYREWWLAAAVLPGLLMSQQRSSLIALACCVTAMLWFKKRWLAPVMFLLLLAAALAPKTMVQTEGLIAAKNLMFESLAQRVDIWRDTISGLTIFGHGIGNFYAAFPYYAARVAAEGGPSWVIATHAHNDILEIAFELGVIGLVLTLALAWCIWRQAQAPERYGLAAVAITGLAGFPLHMPFTAAVAAYLAGVAVGARHRLCRDPLHSRLRLYEGRQSTDLERPAMGGTAIPV